MKLPNTLINASHGKYYTDFLGQLMSYEHSLSAPCSSRIGGNALRIDHSRFSIGLGLLSVHDNVIHDCLGANELLLQVGIAQGTLADGVCNLCLHFGFHFSLHSCLGLGLFGSDFSDRDHLSSYLICLCFLFDGLHLLLSCSDLGFGLLHSIFSLLDFTVSLSLCFLLGDNDLIFSLLDDCGSFLSYLHNLFLGSLHFFILSLGFLLQLRNSCLRFLLLRNPM